VDASISHSIVDWFSYKNIPKEEELYVQLNALAANVILSTLSVEVQDEAIYNGQTPSSSAHVIWVKLFELYGKPNDNECYVWKTKDNMSTILHCNEETSDDPKSAEPKLIKADAAVLVVQRILDVSDMIPDVSGMAVAAGQQADQCSNNAPQWRSSDESTIESHDSHQLCLMAKKSKKKKKKATKQEKAQEDDQR